MDYKAAASYWEKKDETGVQMERDDLLAEMERFLTSHSVCALATGSGDFVRCTPIEYTYWQGALWMLSEGGLKFRALEQNRNVCVAVYGDSVDFGNLSGMQISGTAEMIEPWSGMYLSMLEYKKIPAESLRKIPHPLYLIRVQPTGVDFLCSAFREKGCSARQHLTFETSRQ
jgi:hypothetical protein